MLKNLLKVLAVLALTMGFAAADIAEYNLTGPSLALKGHDPVAYYPEGGGAPTLGSEEFATEHNGVLYHFVSKANMDLFLGNPAKYEPTYGGWCAFAMANGQKVDPDLSLFDIQDGRLMLFVPGTKDRWINNRRSFTIRANRHWQRISGEETKFFAE